MMSEQTDWQYPGSRLLVFADTPRPGDVKPRLAEVMGAEQAAQAYADWLADFVTRLAAARLAPLQLWLRPDDAHPLWRHLREAIGVDLQVQPGGDPAQRIRRVMLQTLVDCKSAVLLGSDCPVMSSGYVRRALAVMEAGTATVLGPATDGACLLLGLRSASAPLFVDVPWGSARVMPAIRRRLAGAGGGWAELEPLWHIEQPADYRRWQHTAAAGGDPTAGDGQPAAGRAINNEG